jgi:hypothetical protein
LLWRWDLKTKEISRFFSSLSDFDPQAYHLYGEDQNHETSFKAKALQAVVDGWCKIQVIG